ncbi:Increased recombination centers protein 22 [Exophiala xenobiotica]|uniref:Increased recombination centers protein 22 n=1 Tax=Vermiconidia calcicola TaxID=1690605 RepID=A0AAV9QFJ2_9PEZI|nr:Increased recombination centers protein 22 [Exophiala xenobiotica]KAK5539900.1 Increased recombination centers protein 22 [Vermiconidia calcicola]KAK5546981.1 Increased recombination centers protein 22 [Chaetothyriales sp. CCFEE 6169]KAK5274672.1 Increased recombination centers protein 22 [Exophiala xenobiotica]KAK5293763.1 Increased recombination centers protein 22 [Exophiala xenobiotica]
MGRFLNLAALLLVGFRAAGTFAQAADAIEEEVENPSTSPALAVSVEASFPDAEIFGIKLVNGKPTESVLSFMNEEPEPVTVQFVGGSLWTPDLANPRIIRNLTTAQYAIEIPPGEKQSLPYRFQTNMHPQDMRLNLAAVVSSHNTFYTLQAFNGTVSIVEPDASIFDPQILFLYLFLLACAVGVGYFFYNIWIVPYFPQKRKAGSKKTPVKKIDVGSVVSDNEGPAVSTGAQKYNEEWIPSHHIQRPEARRLKSGGRPKSRGKPE